MSYIFVWISGTLIVLSAILVTLEVLLRKVLNMSFGGADELSGYAFGIATSFSLAYAFFQKAHIRVDAAYNLFPQWLKCVADFTGIILLAGFVGFVTAMAWELVADTIAHDSHAITPLRTPLTFPQVPWLFGWLFFLFCIILHIVTATITFVRRDMKRTQELIGIKTINRQVDEEIA